MKRLLTAAILLLAVARRSPLQAARRRNPIRSSFGTATQAPRRNSRQRQSTYYRPTGRPSRLTGRRLQPGSNVSTTGGVPAGVTAIQIRAYQRPIPRPDPTVVRKVGPRVTILAHGRHRLTIARTFTAGSRSQLQLPLSLGSTARWRCRPAVLAFNKPSPPVRLSRRSCDVVFSNRRRQRDRTLHHQALPNPCRLTAAGRSTTTAMTATLLCATSPRHSPQRKPLPALQQLRYVTIANAVPR